MARKPTKRERRAHIVMADGFSGMRCTHCGDSKQFELPAPIKAVIADIEAFSLRHEDCKPKDKTTK